jgi:lysophospholipase L1-like esterase
MVTPNGQARLIRPQRARGDLIAVGDSLVAGGYSGQSWANRVTYRSDGKYVLRRNYAVGGKLATEILTEQIPVAVSEGRGRMALFDGGLNDLQIGTSESVTRARVIACWDALKAAGIDFLDMGMVPNDNGIATALADHELWRQLYCARKGYSHINPFRLLANADGTFQTAYKYDNVHPNSVGHNEIARRALEILDNYWTNDPLLEIIDRQVSGVTVLRNTVSFGGVAAALPTGYSAIGSGGTYSVEAPDAEDPDQIGNWLTCSVSGATSGSVGFQGTNSRSIAALGWTAGDRIAVGMQIKWTGAPGVVSPRVLFNQSDVSLVINPVYDERAGTADGDDVYTYGEYTLGSASVNLAVTMQTTGAGSFSIRRPILYNLTQNGLA